jgi:hypothetical protein
MQYTLASSTLEPIRTVSHEAPFTAAGITEAATRLRSWALIRGEKIVGLPFLRLSGNLRCDLHLPVDWTVRPHPETGISGHSTDAMPAVAVRVVSLDEVRPVLQALSSEISSECGIAGPVEFHPGSAEFTHGTIVWPVHRAPRSLTAVGDGLVSVGA